MTNVLSQVRRLEPTNAGEPARLVPTSAKNLFRRVVEGGELIVVPGALQAAGMLDEINDTLLRCVEARASARVREQVARAGWACLHEYLDGGTIERVWADATSQLLPRTTEFGVRLGRDLFGLRERCYVARRFWLRMYTPEQVRRQHESLFSLRAGFLQGTHPHRDSVFTAATNSIVVWAALGPVRAGNSMILYPEKWRQKLSFQGFEARGLRPAPDLPLGRPTTVALEPGDMLLFSGEHLHSSEVNVTEQTRVSMTLRIAAAPPSYGTGGRWLPYVDAKLASGPFAFAATARARCSRAYLEHLLIRRGLWRARVAAHRSLPGWFDDPQRALVEQRMRVAQAAPAITPPPLGTRAIPDDRIVAISPSVCVASIGGRLHAIARHCPHCGTDLSVNGYLRETSILCAADDLRFDVATGASPCAAVPRLQVYTLPDAADTGATMLPAASRANA